MIDEWSIGKHLEGDGSWKIKLLVVILKGLVAKTN
jgi:hypothetical protein